MNAIKQYQIKSAFKEGLPKGQSWNEKHLGRAMGVKLVGGGGSFPDLCTSAHFLLSSRAQHFIVGKAI